VPKKKRSSAATLDQNLTIRVSDEMRDHLDQIADKRGLTVGAIARLALEAGLVSLEEATEEPS